MMYKAVAQTVLLFDSNSCVVTLEMLKVVEELHHRLVWWIKGMMYRRADNGEWEYPLVDDAMESAGLCLIKEYIQRRQATIAAQVACRIIYELCTWA